jgi:hypothetical protein
MKRFLVQLDGTKYKLVKLNESSHSHTCSSTCCDSECKDIEASTDETAVDLTNCPNDEVLLQAGREFW